MEDHKQLIDDLRAASGDKKFGVNHIIRQAADVIESLSERHNNLVRETTRPKRDWKGCGACYGSGGKRADPCKECNGTGKVKL